MSDILKRLQACAIAGCSPPERALALEAAAEIARLREERRWVPVGERLPEKYQRVIVAFTPDSRGVVEVCEAVHNFGSDFETDKGCYECSHWMPLPPEPEANG